MMSTRPSSEAARGTSTPSRGARLVGRAVTREFVQPPLSRGPALDDEGLERLGVMHAAPVVDARVHAWIAVRQRVVALREPERARGRGQLFREPLEAQQHEPRAGGRVRVRRQAEPVALRPPDRVRARGGVVAGGAGVGFGRRLVGRAARLRVGAHGGARARLAARERERERGGRRKRGERMRRAQRGGRAGGAASRANQNALRKRATGSRRTATTAGCTPAAAVGPAATTRAAPLGFASRRYASAKLASCARYSKCSAPHRWSQSYTLRPFRVFSPWSRAAPAPCAGPRRHGRPRRRPPRPRP